MKRLLVLLTLSVFAFFSHAQVDTEFWFAAPYATVDHGPGYTAAAVNIYDPGGQPVSITITTTEITNVVIDIPAQGFTLRTLTIDANTTQKIEFTKDEMDYFIPDVDNYDLPQSIGIRIKANADITVFYELEAVLNPDIFALKGSNALGTVFYLPSQNKWDNDPRHEVGGVLGAVHGNDPFYYDEARSYAFIVATEDNTVINITPTAALENGHPANITFPKTLNKGEVYVIEAESNLAAGHLGGTKIEVISGGPVAVTIGDDSMYDQSFDICGKADYWRFEDYNGDQIVPIDLLGNEYVIMKSQVGFNAEDMDALNWDTPDPNDTIQCDVDPTGIELHEHVFITAIEDGTTINIDGLEVTLNESEQYAYDLTNTTNALYAHITSDKPIYVYHLGGFVREMGGAILPPIDNCTGSYRVGFGRNTGNNNEEYFTMNLMVRSGGETSFKIDENQTATDIVNNAVFEQVGTSSWMVAVLNFSVAELEIGQHLITNSKQPFHIGILGSTAHDWNDGRGFKLMGANYGYFSGYQVLEPDAWIAIAGRPQNECFPIGYPPALQAEGGHSFSWSGYYNTGTDANPIWTVIPTTMHPSFYLDDVNSYRPQIDEAIPLGQYRFDVFIDTDVECWPNDTIISLYVCILDAVFAENVTDTVCESEPGLGCSECYNLYELEDTIIGGRKALVLGGNYIEGWYEKVAAQTININDLGTWTSGINATYTKGSGYIYEQVPGNAIRQFTFGNGNPRGDFSITINDPSNYIDIATDSQLFLDVYQNYEVQTNEGNAPLVTVTVEMTNTNMETVTATAIVQKPLWGNNVYKNFWQTLTFDYNGATPLNTGGFNSISVTMTSNPEWGTGSLYIDNLVKGTTVLEDFETNLNTTWLAGTKGTLGPIQVAPPTNILLNNLNKVTASNEPGYIELALAPQDYIDLNAGTVFSIDLASQYSLSNKWNWANINIRMALVDLNGNVTYQNGASIISDQSSNTIKLDEPWHTFSADFAGAPLTKYKAIRLYNSLGTTGIDYSYVFDNITFEAADYYAEVTDTTCHYICNGDTLWAVVLNRNSSTFRDTAYAAFAVLPFGRDVHHIIDGPFCATYGNILEGVDLDDYKYAVGGALVGEKKWHYNEALTITVDDDATPQNEERNVSVTGPEQTFWAEIWDECKEEMKLRKGSVTIEVDSKPVLESVEVELCGDLSVSINGDMAKISLLAQEDDMILSSGTWITEWYYDADLTLKISGSDVNNLGVHDGDILYAKVYSNDAECSEVATVTVSVIPVEPIVFEDEDFCADADDFTLTATPDGGAFIGDGVSGFTFDPQAVTAGTHKLYYTYAFGGRCPVADSALFTVYEQIEGSITGNPANDITYNTATDLTANITSGGTYSYVWNTGETTATINTGNLTEMTTYHVTVTNTATNCTAVFDYTVTLLEIEPHCTINAPKSCENTMIDLTVETSGGSGNITIDWDLSNLPTGTYTQTDDKTVNVEAQTTALISVTVTDEVAQSTTCSTTFVVNPNPILGLPADPTVCQNQPLTLDENVSGGTEPYIHAWTPTTIVQSGSNTDAVDINTANAGTYNLHYSIVDANKCKGADDILVTINPLPVIDTIIAPESACAGNEVSFSVQYGAGGVSPLGVHSWTANSTITTYFSATDISNPTMTVPSLYGFHDITYTYTNQYGCDASYDLTFQVQSKPDVTLPDVDPMCVANENVALKATVTLGEAPYNYQWTNVASNDQAGNALVDRSYPQQVAVSVTVIDTNNCISDPKTINVAIYENPDATIFGDDNVCLYADLELRSAEITGVSYEWFGNGSSYLDQLSGSPVIFTPQNVNDYYTIRLTASREVTTGLTCSSFSNKLIHVIELPEVILGDDKELCVGNEFQLAPKDSSGTALALGDYTKIEWALDDEQLSSTDNLTPIFTQPDENTYSLALTVYKYFDLNNTCKNSDTIMFIGLQNPVAFAGVDRNDVAPDLDGIIPDASASGGTPGYTYSWVSNPAGGIQGSNEVQSPTYNIPTTTRFILTVEDSKGCKHTDEVEYNVCGGKPTSNPIPDTVCVGDTAILRGFPNGGECNVTPVYKWLNENNIELQTSSTSNTLIVSNPVDGAIYKFVHISGAYEPDTALVTLVVYQNPVVTFDTDTTNLEVCFADSKTLHATATAVGTDITYTWDDGSGLAINDQTYVFSNSSTLGIQEIYLTVSDGLCYTRDTVRFKVVPLPTVTIDNDTACMNIPLAIEATPADGSGVYTGYQWAEPVGNDFLTNSNGAIATFLGDTAGRYTITVTVTDDNNCKGSDVADIIVKPEPERLLIPPYPACAEDTLVLDFNPDNRLDYTALVTIIGGNEELIIDDSDPFKKLFRAINPGNYKIIYTLNDGFGCPIIDSVAIRVDTSVNIATITDIDICHLLNKEFTANVGDLTGVDFLWTGDNISPRTAKTVEFSALQPGATTITVRAQKGVCKDTEQFTVTVRPNPVVFAGFPPNPVLAGKQYSLNAILTKPTTGAYEWIWEPSTAIYGNNLQQNVLTVAIEDLSYTYTVSVRDFYTCTASDEIKLNLLPPPEIKAGWPKNGDVVSLINQVDTNIVKVEWTEQAELCLGDSIQLLAYVSDSLAVSSAPYYNNYTWYEVIIGDTVRIGAPKETQMNPFVTPTVGLHTYRVVARSEYDVVEYGQVIVNVHKNPTATFTYDDYNGTVYTMHEVDLYGSAGISGPGTITHSWSGGPHVVQNPDVPDIATFYAINEIPYTVNYTATITYTSGFECFDTYTRTFHPKVLEELKIEVYPACVGDSATLRIPGGYTGAWSIGGASPAFAVSKNSVNVEWITAGEQTIYVVLDENGVIPTDKPIIATVKIYEQPVVELFGPAHVCEYSQVEYTAETNAPYVSWYIGSWESAALGDSIKLDEHFSDHSAIVHWEQEDVDQVKVVAHNVGCRAADSMLVSIHPNPDPSFIHSPQSDINRGDDVTFTNTTTYDAVQKKYVDDPNLEFYWDYIGDGVYTDNIYEDTYAFDESGIFDVTLMAIDTVWGCKGYYSDTVLVIPNDECFMTFPNAFTPTIDDYEENMTFYPIDEVGVLEIGYELRIYNRWGTLLWSTTNKHDKWDGEYKNEVVKQDVYVYHCQATCEKKDKNGKPVILNIQGDVTVIK